MQNESAMVVAQSLADIGQRNATEIYMKAFESYQKKLQTLLAMAGALGVVSAILCAAAMDNGDFKTACSFFLLSLLNAMNVFVIKK